jgi:hypothetical protein
LQGLFSIPGFTDDLDPNGFFKEIAYSGSDDRVVIR